MKPTVEPSDFAGGRKLVDFERKERARSIRIEKRKEKKKRQDERRKIREALGDKAPPKLQPKTIENTREQDVTMVDPADEEVIQDEALDEMSTYFNRVTKPKVLITISPGAKQETWKFCHELHNCIPNSDMYSRKSCPMKKVVKRAIEEGFTDIIVINEDRRIPNAMTICHLPSGPTAYFRLRSIQRSKELKRHGAITDHYPEVILNNFNTRLGHTVGRMLACLFPYDPQFRGRRVVTFHNQRDYIFFRHHRYEFKNGGKRAALLELGPRFTLRLRSLQKGTFDTKFGEYEWILKVSLGMKWKLADGDSSCDYEIWKTFCTNFSNLNDKFERIWHYCYLSSAVGSLILDQIVFTVLQFWFIMNFMIKLEV